MFSDCNSLASLNLSSFNTLHVTYMNGMFSDCHSLTSLNLSSFNTSSAINMSQMFYNCLTIEILNLNKIIRYKNNKISSRYIFDAL